MVIEISVGGTSNKCYTNKPFVTLLIYCKFPLTTFGHYANTPMQYTAIFHGYINAHFQMKFFTIFLIFAQHIDCGYTHNLCFRAKIRKKRIPL